MTGYPSSEPKLCLLGRVAQKFGCLPDKSATSTPVYYPIAVRSADSGYGYTDDIKYKPGPRLPPPQPDEPKPQMTPSITTYQHKSPRVPKSPKKTPVARTVPLSTLPLPVNALPVFTQTPTCVTQNVDLPLVHPIVQITHTPYFTPLSAIPPTPHQNTFPNSILQDLGNIAPTQYTWDTPRGALTWTPAPTSNPLPNPFADSTPCSPRIVDVGNGDDGSTGLGLIPGPISSDSSNSSDCSDHDNPFGVRLHQFFTSNGPSPEGTPIVWNVSDPTNMARCIVDDPAFLRVAHQPVTNPSTNTLLIDFCFIDQPGLQWNWEPITIRKPRPIRITDVLHAIHDYFQLQLTHSEYDNIKAYGKRNARIVANSWRERVSSQLDSEEQSEVFHGGLRRVDCLGSCKNFAGLWVEGSQLKLGLRA